MLESYQSLTNILSQAANMTVNKLSTSQELQIKTGSMELNYKKKATNNFTSEIALTGSKIIVPNL